MNRQIKFRGKRVDNGEWIYGDLLHGTSSLIGVRAEHTFIGTDWDFNEVRPETVGQYTGVEDAEDTDIYEGDKVVLYERFTNGNLLKEHEGGVVFGNLGAFR
jgi:uncharacterized phage protein (TIGR01671 family)